MEQGDRTVSLEITDQVQQAHKYIQEAFDLSDVNYNSGWISWESVINAERSNFDRWMDIVDETESLIDFLDQIQKMDYGERLSGGMSVNDIEERSWRTYL